MSIISLVSGLFGCGPKVVSTGKVASGRFEIRWEVISTRKGMWSNQGGDITARQLTCYYSIYHNGQLVEIPDREGKTQLLWQALFLADAPSPAILAGNNSLYLITEQNGGAEVTPLLEQEKDFATFQWLDSNNGQPGTMERIYLGDYSRRDRFFRGGRYLLAGKNRVLDVKSLTTYEFTESNFYRTKALDDYSYSNSSVLAFSPDKTKLVYVANRQNPSNYLLHQYALVVVDYKTDSAYAVPFDRTDTRYERLADATPEWMVTFFEWRKDGNVDQLVRKRLAALPPWQGRFGYDQFSEKVNQYALVPANEPLVDILFQFLKTHYEVSEVQLDEMADFHAKSIHLKIDGRKMMIYFRKDEQSLSLSGDSTGIIEKYGRAFDAELAKGKYQEHFGRLP